MLMMIFACVVVFGGVGINPPDYRRHKPRQRKSKHSFAPAGFIDKGIEKVNRPQFCNGIYEKNPQRSQGVFYENLCSG